MTLFSPIEIDLFDTTSACLLSTIQFWSCLASDSVLCLSFLFPQLQVDLETEIDTIELSTNSVGLILNWVTK